MTGGREGSAVRAAPEVHTSARGPAKNKEYLCNKNKVQGATESAVTPCD